MKETIRSIAALVLLGGYTLYAGGDIAPVYEPAVSKSQPVATPLEPLYYVGGGLAVAGLSRDCPCNNNTRLKDMTYGLALRAGVDIIDYLGIEARYLSTFIEKDFSEVTHYGIYLKPYYPISNSMTLYGLFGYGKTSVDYTGMRRSSTLDKSGFSYGGGMEFMIQNDISVWVDAQHLLGSEGRFDTDVNVGTAGVLYRFNM